MTDFASRLEVELKRRYDLCEDCAATPSNILLAVLNAVAEARKEGPSSGDSFTSRPPQQGSAAGVLPSQGGLPDTAPERVAPAAEQSAPKCRHCAKVLGNHFVKERRDAANPSCNESMTGTTFEEEHRVGERRKGGRREFSDCCWAGTSKNRRSSRDRRSGSDRRGGR